MGEARNGVRYAVLNLQGRTFMTPLEDPFRAAERELAAIPPEVKVIIVDMHAEATSEKQAMGWFLDGKVSAVLGTHTHVATADNRVLPGGTAYITDVGMTGPHDSVIGMEKKPIVQRFLDSMPAKFTVAENDVQMNTVQITVDETTGRASAIERVNFRLDYSRREQPELLSGALCAIRCGNDFAVAAQTPVCLRPTFASRPQVRPGCASSPPMPFGEQPFCPLPHRIFLELFDPFGGNTSMQTQAISGVGVSHVSPTCNYVVGNFVSNSCSLRSFRSSSC